jgi:hypothetical protein
MPSFDAGQTGITPGVTILNADGTVHTAHTTAGFTEAVTGSGVYNYPHPSPGTLLEFVFDATVGGDTLYASVWDDGLTPQGAAEAAIVAQDVSTFDAAIDAVQVGNIDDIDAALSAAHGSGSWGESVEDGVTIDPTTLGTDGLPIERVMPYGKITVYLNGVAQDSFDADADGDFSFKLPKGSVWTLVASNPPLYRSTSVDVSTIPVVE